ncbi:MAG: hypothetical protein D3904_12485 [Candidatus Electrothrix sp. EH2]|nr:hypothetical protein [Candidatus Electrothrix sp. EH2]
MTISTEYLLYVALYRLTVLAVGALSIYWGFRLFTRFNDRQGGDSDISSPDAKIWKVRLNLNNVWPASFFTLFGTGLIAVMLWQGAPRVTLEDIKAATDRTVAIRENSTQGKGVSSPPLDPRTPQSFSPEVQERLDREWNNLKQPGLTLAEASVHLTQLARIHRKAGQISEALLMARLASLYGSAQDRASRLILYAELLEESGEIQKAVQVHRELVELGQFPESPQEIQKEE